MEKINLKKASTYYMIGNLFNKGMSFLTVPIFTTLLETDEYGVVVNYNGYLSILTMVMGLAIYMGIRAAFIDYKDKIDDFMAVSTTFTITSGIVISLGAIIILGFMGPKISIALVIVCLIQGIASALMQNYIMYLMMKYRYKFRTALMILPNLISVIISVIVIYFFMNNRLYLGRIIPTAAVQILFALITVVLVYKKSKVYFNKEYLVYGLKISAPLVVHGIGLYILSTSDRNMISSLRNDSETGIYGVIYNFGTIATAITTALDGVWIPWFTERLKNKEQDKINEVVKGYINIITYAMMGVILVGPEVVKLLARKPQYWEGISIIPPIVLANYICFAYSLYVNIEHYHKKTLYVTINTIIAACSNLILNFIFIPKYGYVAAAYTTLVSYFIAFVLHSIYAKKLENLYPFKTFILPILELTAATVLFYVLMDQWYIRWPMIMAFVGVMLYVDREKCSMFLPFGK
ncbi:MAG: oligosaccharide flippase family protein [Eubacterium sp.]|nr:oligosaccharide flippase family protein [Eubacterium sp.]